eukprot:8843498-Heterocapsa_arctica.AAC.1
MGGLLLIRVTVKCSNSSGVLLFSIPDVLAITIDILATRWPFYITYDLERPILRLKSTLV